VIVAPPFDEGAFQPNPFCPLPAAALRFCGAPGTVAVTQVGAVAWSEPESVLPVAFLARIKYVYVVPAVTFDPVFRKLRVPAGTPGEYKLPFR
jgi:hypothetical protein